MSNVLFPISVFFRCLVFDVWFPLLDIRPPISVFWTPISPFWDLIPDVRYAISGVRFPTSDVQSPTPAPDHRFPICFSLLTFPLCFCFTVCVFVLWSLFSFYICHFMYWHVYCCRSRRCCCFIFAISTLFLMFCYVFSFPASDLYLACEISFFCSDVRIPISDIRALPMSSFRCLISVYLPISDLRFPFPDIRSPISDIPLPPLPQGPRSHNPNFEAHWTLAHKIQKVSQNYSVLDRNSNAQIGPAAGQFFMSILL